MPSHIEQDLLKSEVEDIFARIEMALQANQLNMSIMGHRSNGRWDACSMGRLRSATDHMIHFSYDFNLSKQEQYFFQWFSASTL